jgi:type I restriction enzyme R subunit
MMASGMGQQTPRLDRLFTFPSLKANRYDLAFVDRAFQKKTNELVQKHIGATIAETSPEFFAIDKATIETIKSWHEGAATKVINLVKAIQNTAEKNSDDPFLIALAERAKAVRDSYEDRQTTTTDALDDLLKEIERNEKRQKEQQAKGLDSLSYFVLTKLTEEKVSNADAVTKSIREAFAQFPNWQRSEGELRELRKKVKFALVREEDDIEKVTAIVESLFLLLQKGKES